MMGKMFSGKKSNGGKSNTAKDQSGGESGGTNESVGGMVGDTASMRSTSAASDSSSSGAMAKPNFRNKATNVSKKVAGIALNQGAKEVGAALGASIGLMAGKPVEGALVGGAIGGFGGKTVQKVGQGSMWVGKKAYSGVQKVADWVGSNRGGEESELPTVDEPTVSEPYVEKPVQLSRSTRSNREEQPFRSNRLPYAMPLPSRTDRMAGEDSSKTTVYPKIVHPKTNTSNQSNLGAYDEIEESVDRMVKNPAPTSSPVARSQPSVGGKNYNYHV
ncbi:hypothetical protein D3C74_265900 [compost metagenome]